MWSLYDKSGFLQPLVFSNGKSQEDVVREVLGEINKGNKVIFIRGACGTGKSAIALNIAKELGKSSIVVPGKNLQRQYKKDYEKEKYVLKKDGPKLKISVITGRNNHKCRFMQESKEAIPVIKKEVNSKLYDIFEGKIDETNTQIGDDESADNKDLPCKIELKERNWDKIKQYLIKNKLIDSSKMNEIRDVRRTSVASVCPYWSPVFKSRYEFKGPIFKDAEIKKYIGLNGNEFTFYQRKRGCHFYEQFNSFIDSDVIVFNSLKYKLETVMDRKPLTEVEIIDECDEFLDSFSNQRTINLDRMQNALIQAVKEKEYFDSTIKEMFEILKHLRENQRIKEAGGKGDIIPLKETGVYDLMKIIANNPETFADFDDESYLFSVEEIAKTFSDLVDETYITIEKKDNNLLINLVAVNLAKKFNEFVKKNKIIVLMSGTIHSEEVLKNIYGIENFVILDAEPKGQGKIHIKKTGKENNFKYSNLSSGNTSREEYLKALDKCVSEAKRPTLVHINAFADMPSSLEIGEFELKNLISKDEIRNMQDEDKEGNLIEEFKKGNRDILFSTKVARGIDFPGKQCNSIVFTKYPNPNVQDTFWKILYKTKPQHYWSFYKDKAKRELWQKIYRGLRFKDDEVEIWSPDERVLDEVVREMRG
ncbi:DEAD/DEAH box helicase family protein [Candidatus Pacearchaeota archaeon]|nr:DEAD/DEAH box helicase family protein [Candidatus Pacearchaeota archaeon]